MWKMGLFVNLELLLIFGKNRFVVNLYILEDVLPRPLFFTKKFKYFKISLQNSHFRIYINVTPVTI